jgi:hypothetical protein
MTFKTTGYILYKKNTVFINASPEQRTALKRELLKENKPLEAIFA